MVTQLKAFLLKNRSKLSEDDIILLSEVICQLKEMSSINDASIRKKLLGECCKNMMRFFGLKRLWDSRSDMLEDINDLF